MDFYLTDREYNVLAVASTGDGVFRIVNDTDDQLVPQSVGRTYTATLISDEAHAGELATIAAIGNFVLYKDPRGTIVFATIMAWDEANVSDFEIPFTAVNGGIDLTNETVAAYKSDKAMTIADYILYFTSDSGFEIGINELQDATRTLEWEGDGDSSLTRIESVATQFGAELDFRFEVVGTQVTRFLIDIYKHIGSDKGERLEVNTHLNSIKTSASMYDLCTSIYGTGAAEDGGTEAITLKGYKWVDPEGRYVLGGDGVLRDTVAVQQWSRLKSKANPNPTSSHIQRDKSYEATSQATLLQSVLSDLKKFNHVTYNYTVDIADLPDGVEVGDTVHLVDEQQDLNLSARLLELKDSWANDTHEATFGDYLIEASQIDPALQALADQMQSIKANAAHQYYPWTRYADDENGAGISAFPAGKSYMAVVWSDESAVPSDDPNDYSGHWQKVKGDDGVGEQGPKGDDGKNSYFHTAYADDVAGTGLSQSPNGKDYIGTYSDFSEADSTAPSDYTWALIKGDKGDKGDAGSDITSYDSGPVLPSTVAPKNSQFWLTDSDGVATAFYKSDGSNWVAQQISASAIAAATFNGLTFNGVNFNGSHFTSTFEHEPVDESDFDDVDDPTGEQMLTKGTGTTKMGDGYLTVDGTIDGSSGTMLQTFHSEVGPAGYLSRLYTGGTSESHITASSQLYLGQLFLSNQNTSGTRISGYLNGEMLQQIDNVGRLIWTGATYLGWSGDAQAIDLSVSIDQCLNGWLLVWHPMVNNQVDNTTNIRVTPIWKSEVMAHPNVGIVLLLGGYFSSTATKYVYPTATRIRGNTQNNNAPQTNIVLTEVYGF